MKVSAIVVAGLLCLVSASNGLSQKAPKQSSNKRYDPRGNAPSRREMDEGDRRIYEKAESALSQVYNKLMSRLDERQKTNLEKAQQAWMKYKDANCELASDFVYQQCLTRMTRERTTELNSFRRRFLTRR